MNVYNEQHYLYSLDYILRLGEPREDRTGVGTLSVFSPTEKKYHLWESFPALTTKKLAWKQVVTELLWFISGDTNVKALQDRGCNIWNSWAAENGDLGPVYGAQWRGVFDDYHQKQSEDQLANVIEEIKTNPTSRRLIVSAWNVGDLEHMALPPCHAFFQFYVDGDEIDLKLTQRSGDMFLGVPFNVASYSLLLHIVGHLTGKTPRHFIHSLGDAHIYSNHIDQVRKQLSRPMRTGPQLKFSERALAATHIDDFKLGNMETEDFILEGYDPHPAIKAPVAV